jgi:hypothetical protein
VGISPLTNNHLFTRRLKKWRKRKQKRKKQPRRKNRQLIILNYRKAIIACALMAFLYVPVNIE